jgi:starch-binding outer membrane protein, SusD/RagB family
MKYKLLLIISLGLIIGSCSDEWLNDGKPQGMKTVANFYNTPEELQSSLVGVYSMFKNQYWTGVWSSPYLYASLGSDDAVAHGGGRADRPEFWEIDDYAVTPINPSLLPVWNRCYYGINRACVIIERVDLVAHPEFAGMVGEAKMMRAYFYFDLVREFGEVPVFDHVLLPSEYQQEKQHWDKAFELIVQDLKEAAEVLPVSYNGGDRYRMTKYGALGLLGKVYVYMASPLYGMDKSNYDNAAEVLKQVIDEGPYALESDYDRIWWYGNEFNKETLIEMSYGSTDPADHWGNGADATGNVIQQLCGPRGFGGALGDTLVAAWGFDMVTQNLVDQYRALGDSIRLHAVTLAEWQMVALGGIINERNDAYTGYYSKKRATWAALNPDRAAWAWGNNERILRLGEIYLLYAEAKTLGNNPDYAEARSYINKLRDRVNLPHISDALQGDQLMDAIKLERRLELAQEGNRYFDLIRWKDAQTVLGPLGFQYPKNNFFPIPQSEIEASGGKLIQNENY